MDPSGAGCVGIFPRWTNQTQDAWVYSHDGPIRCRMRGYIPTVDQSDAGRAGIFPRWTNQMQDMRVYSHGGPIRCRTRGYIPTVDQSYADGARYVVLAVLNGAPTHSCKTGLLSSMSTLNVD
eukprot:1193093-Prorocentrum_minimum.AAC.2